MSIKTFLIRLACITGGLFATASFVVMSLNHAYFGMQDQYIEATQRFALISRDKEEVTQIIALNEPVLDSRIESMGMRSLPLNCCRSEYAIYLSAISDASPVERSTAALYRVSEAWEQFIRAQQTTMARERKELEELKRLRNLIVPTSAILLLLVSLAFGIWFINRHVMTPIERLMTYVRQSVRGGEPQRADLSGSVAELKFIQSSFESVIADFRGSLQTRGQRAAEMSQTSDVLERQFQNLIELSEKPAFILDASGAIRTWNKHMVALTGIAKSQANRLIFSQELLTGPSAQIFDDAFQIVRGGGMPDEFRCELTLRGNRIISLQFQLSPQLESALGVNRVLVLVNTPSDDKTLTSEILTSETLAPESAVGIELVSELSSSLHRLGANNKGGAEQVAVRQLEALQTAVQWVGSRSYERDQSVLDLGELVMHFKSTFTPKLMDLDVDITLDLAMTPNAMKFRGNAGSLLTALEKLADNAMESILLAAPPKGQISVSVSLADGPVARIVMADNGGGIESGQERQIFEPFFTTKAVQGHLGLGLTHTRDLIQFMSGSIAVSRAGSPDGLHITIELPLVSE